MRVNKSKTVLSEIVERTELKTKKVWGLRQKEKSSKPACLLDFSLAETARFELACRCRQTDFESAPL